MLDMIHDRNMSKQVKEAMEQLEGRDLLKERNLKQFAFKFSLLVLWKNIHLMSIYSGENTN